MSTATTSRLYATLRTRALTYVPASGVPLSTMLNGQMSRVAPPRSAAYPYAYFTLKSPRVAPQLQELKLFYTFEGFVIGQPRSAQPLCEDIADQWVAALRTYVDSTSGFLRFTDLVAETLPPFNAPADASVVQVRLTGTLHVFPMFLVELSA